MKLHDFENEFRISFDTQDNLFCIKLNNLESELENDNFHKENLSLSIVFNYFGKYIDSSGFLIKKDNIVSIHTSIMLDDFGEGFNGISIILNNGCHYDIMIHSENNEDLHTERTKSFELYNLVNEIIHNIDGCKTNPFNILSIDEPNEIFEILKRSMGLPNNPSDLFFAQATTVLRTALVGLIFDRDVKKKSITMNDLSDRLALNAFRIQMIPPEDPTKPIEEQTPAIDFLELNPSLEPYSHLWCPPTYNFNGVLAKDYYFNYLSNYDGQLVCQDDLNGEPEVPEQMITQHGYSRAYLTENINSNYYSYGFYDKDIELDENIEEEQYQRVEEIEEEWLNEESPSNSPYH